MSHTITAGNSFSLTGVPFTQPRSIPPPRDHALDGLRGVAILLVCLFHYGGGVSQHNPLLLIVGYFTQAGWLGVNLFFALSGFLITDLLSAWLFFPGLQPLSHALAPHPQSPGFRHPLRNFYARRALRIFPLYYAALLACGIAALLAGAHPGQLKSLAIYALFLQNVPSLANRALLTPPPLPIFHLWSLAVEEQFYLLWPFLLLVSRTPRRAFGLSLWIFALTTLARVLLFDPHLFAFTTAQTFATFLPFRAGALTLGAALALHRLTNRATAIPVPQEQTAETEIRKPAREPVSSQKPLLLTTAAALTLFLIAARLNHSFLLNTPSAYTLTLPAADLLAATLVALSLGPNFLRDALSHPLLTFLGRISYGFYVLHILLEPLFDHLGILITHTHVGIAYQAARLIVMFPITGAAAWLSYTFLESPFLGLKRRFPSPFSHPNWVRNPT